MVNEHETFTTRNTTGNHAHRRRQPTIHNQRLANQRRILDSLRRTLAMVAQVIRQR